MVRAKGAPNLGAGEGHLARQGAARRPAGERPRRTVWGPPDSAVPDLSPSTPPSEPATGPPADEAQESPTVSRVPSEQGESGAAPTPPGWDWQPKLRWFAAEIAVVVVGVLIALALNAWWSARQDGARADAYLRQLASDLAETERVMAASDTLMRPTERAVKRLLQSYGEPEPPRDSVLHWIDVGLLTDHRRPVLGTAEALVATGDLALVRDDSLRIAIAAYLDAARAGVTFYETSSERLTEDASDLIRSADLVEALARLPASERDSLAATDPTGLVPPATWSAPFPLDLPAFYADRRAYSAVQLMAIWLSNMSIERAKFRENAAALRTRVDADLAR